MNPVLAPLEGARALVRLVEDLEDLEAALNALDGSLSASLPVSDLDAIIEAADGIRTRLDFIKHLLAAS